MKKALKITFIAVFIFCVYKSNPGFYKAFTDAYVLYSVGGLVLFATFCYLLEKRIAKRH
jgi:hypothetical protein